jgi:hypothetical protein
MMKKGINFNPLLLRETYRLTLCLRSFRAYDEQTLALNKMRGMLEDEMATKRAQMMK